MIILGITISLYQTAGNPILYEAITPLQLFQVSKKLLQLTVSSFQYLLVSESSETIILMGSVTTR